MKRTILAGILSLAAGLQGLTAQPQQKKSAPPAAQPAQPQAPADAGPKGPTAKSKEEQAAIMALNFAQTDPDGTIKAAEELLTKFSDTEFKEIALLMEANAYQKKGDAVKAQIYAQRVLEVNPKDFQASLMLGEILVQSTRENDLDKEEKLGNSEKYLNQTIENVKTAAKPNPQLTDAQWEDGRKYVIAEAHNGLGLVAMTRKKYDLSATEFKMAVEGDPQPAYQVRLASVYQQAGKNDDAIALCDKILADPQLHPQIKQVTQSVRAAAMKAKGAPPAEVKKP